MATPKDSIVTLPNKHLRQRSRRVGVISDAIKKSIQDMKSATLDWEASREHEVGVALAAVQIDCLRRIVIIRHNFDEKTDITFDVYINPRVTKYQGAVVEDFEGCLSIKDIYGRVPRYEKVTIQAQDEQGKLVRVVADGFLARVFQHEIDHINGVMFIDHIQGSREAFYRIDASGKLEQLDYDKEIKNIQELYE